MKVFFDGGVRPVTGMETAVVIAGVAHVRRDLGPGTSMDAEWLALIAAMRLAADLTDATILGDAAAVIAQATRKVRCPPAYRHHLETFDGLPRPAGRLRIRHLRRAQNLAGIALAAYHGR